MTCKLGFCAQIVEVQTQQATMVKKNRRRASIRMGGAGGGRRNRRRQSVSLRQYDAAYPDANHGPFPGPFPGLLALFLALCAGPLQAGDWPQWRGPNRDGVSPEPEVAAAIPAAALPILWQVPVGPGWSSPIIVAGRVYLTDVEMKKPESFERVRCFDEATGKVLWTYGIQRQYPEWALKPGQENGPTSTPILQEGKLYTLGPYGDACCLDAATGALIWQRSLGKDYAIQEMSVRSSPLIEGGLLILPIGGKPDACLLAVDKASGKDVWHALDEDAHNASPIVITAAGKRQLIMWTQQSVSAVDPATGSLLWRERLLTDSNNGTATPVWEGVSCSSAASCSSCSRTSPAPPPSGRKRVRFPIGYSATPPHP
jgi:outer membrane protein assembly factor BamB